MQTVSATLMEVVGVVTNLVAISSGKVQAADVEPMEAAGDVMSRDAIC